MAAKGAKVAGGTASDIEKPMAGHTASEVEKPRTLAGVTLARLLAHSPFSVQSRA